MSDYQGNIIIKNPATPAGPFENGAAPGVWKLSEVLPFVRQGIWPTQGIQGKDTFFPYVSLLLSTTALGNANNNLFVDSSGAFNPISRNGNTTQGSVTPYGASWSNYFDGSGDWLDAPNNAAFGFGTGDYTVEFWLYLNTLPPSGKYTIVDFRPTSSATPHTIYVNSSGYLGFFNGSADVTSSSTPMTAASWTHIAYSRSSGTLRIYVNGVQAYSAANTVDYQSSRPCRIGAAIGGTEGVPGYISNFRVVKGTAVYTAAFTPPTSNLTAISGTSLLTCQSNRFRDASTNNFTITVTGNTSVTEFAPFSPAYPGISYNQSDITNWSGYFDGSGDYLSAGSNSAFAFGTGDFTVECWFYETVSGATNQMLISTDTISGFFLGWDAGTFNFGIRGVAYILAYVPTNYLYQWNHVAVSRSGGTISMFWNGTRVTTTSDSTNFSITGPLVIGALPAASSYYWNGYISNARVVKGSAVYNPSSSSITVPTSPLTAISGTGLLTLQNAAFTDNSTNNFVITPSGNTTVTGNSPFNTVGYWSNYFDGSGDYLTAPDNAALQLSSSDFTIEFWVNFTTVPGSLQGATLVSKFNTSNTGYEVILYNNTMYFQAQTANIGMTYAFTPTAGTWYHIAWTRSGANSYGFINGALVASTSAASGSITNLAQALQIGRRGDNTFYLTGYMSNVRVVKGTAVYTAAFTVPTTPLTAITNTSLLTCQASQFIDSSTNALTITRNGDVSVQSFDPFYTATIASNGGSMYFDNTGDYLGIPASPSLSLGSSAFTLEAWVYGAGAWSTDPIFECRSSGSSSAGYAFLVNSSGYLNVYTAGGFVGNSSATLNVGSWNHVALVRTGTGSNQTTYYINGVASGTITLSGNFTDALTNETKIGGSTSAGENWNGYISNARISKFAVYTAAFTPPTSVLTPSANTNLLVNGMNAGVYDATAINNMETVGNAQVRFPTPFAPANYYAGSFDGSGDYLTAPSNTAFEIGTGQFTLECWIYFNTVTNINEFLWADNSGTTGGRLVMYYSGGSLQIVAAGGAGGTSASWTPVAGQWYHLAASRDASNNQRLFVNGALLATATSTNNYTQNGFAIARAASLNGYMSNVRLVKGTAVYTSAFTPSTTPLTAISGTSLLTCQNKTFIDNSTNAFTITAFGNATAGAIGPFTATGGSSMYFDGSGDNLFMPSATSMNFGTGNWTIECWVYVSTRTTNYPLVFGNNRGSFTTDALALTASNSDNASYNDKFVIAWGSAGWTSPSAGNSQLLVSNVTNSTGTWYHLAIVRDSSTSVKMFRNGTQVANATVSSGATFNWGYSGTFVGGGNWDGAQGYFNGYIDDLRVTAGVARYTANFTPPTQAFPPY